MITTYEMAYVEVLAILKNYLKEEEFNKIPKEKIDFFEKHKDRNYIFNLNNELPIEKQSISEKANAILVILYRDYFANEFQKLLLKQIIEKNDEITNNKIEKNSIKDIESYNTIFKNNKNIDNIENKGHYLIKIEKEKWYKKIINNIKKFLNIN